MHHQWKRGGIVLATVSVLCSAAGCSRIASQTISEVRGATGDLIEGAAITDTYFARYNALDFQPATTSMPSAIVPRSTLRAYDAAARNIRNEEEELREYFDGGEPTVRIACEMLYFKKKGLLSAGEGLARVRFHEGGREVLDSVVRVETKSYARGDIEDLAEAVVETIAKYLIDHKEEARKRRERG